MLKEFLIASANNITNLTNTISTSATPLSKLMDTAGGGTEAHGGFHRIFGGHDFWDPDLWSSHGTDYAQELMKDFITPNGLPLPGTKVLVEKFGLATSAAQKWGAVNIGDVIGGGFACIDSVSKYRRYKNDNQDSEIHRRDIISLSIKVVVAAQTTNPIMAASAIADAALLVKKLSDSHFEDSFEYNPLSFNT